MYAFEVLKTQNENETLQRFLNLKTTSNNIFLRKKKKKKQYLCDVLYVVQ